MSWGCCPGTWSEFNLGAVSATILDSEVNRREGLMGCAFPMHRPKTRAQLTRARLRHPLDEIAHSVVQTGFDRVKPLPTAGKLTRATPPSIQPNPGRHRTRNRRLRGDRYDQNCIGIAIEAQTLGDSMGRSFCKPSNALYIRCFDHCSRLLRTLAPDLFHLFLSG